MRREHPQHLGVRRILTIFAWHHCEVCRKEFRRELGWHKTIGPYCHGAYGITGRDAYACGSCCQTPDAASDALGDGRPRGSPPGPLNQHGRKDMQ